MTTETTGPADTGDPADATEANTQARLYYDRVVAALAGLAPDIRQDLLEDLPDHLAEVAAEISAEGSGSLRDRLGEPEAYALELRAAAGLEAAPPVAGTMATGLAQGARRASELARRLDLQGGRLVGYPRLQDLLRALRPGWWVLRGWLAAELVAGAHDRESWSGFIPDIGGNRLLGLLVTLAMIAASVALGQRSLGLSAWGRRAVAAASVLIALWGVGVLATNVGGTAYAYSGPGQDYVQAYSAVRDVYVYDSAGRLVEDARLFDQDGNPIQLGAGYCANGLPAPGASYVQGYPGYPNLIAVWNYPLCPADPGPFRSGPPPLTPTPSPSLPDQSGSPQPAPSATPSASTGVTPSTVPPSTVKPSTVKPSAVKPTATSTRR
ncbi:MAG TPA: hypothetical protein VGX49_17065 [Jatrophihabitans sp.]|nr:hypothetical protein [Jatrophihabitans sp.]